VRTIAEKEEIERRMAALSRGRRMAARAELALNKNREDLAKGAHGPRPRVAEAVRRVAEAASQDRGCAPQAATRRHQATRPSSRREDARDDIVARHKTAAAGSSYARISMTSASATRFPASGFIAVLARAREMRKVEAFELGRKRRWPGARRHRGAEARRREEMKAL